MFSRLMPYVETTIGDYQCGYRGERSKVICWFFLLLNLLYVTYKIFSNIMFSRLMPYVETTIGDYQCGYRGERSTVDQIFTVCQILEKCGEHGKDTHHLFIDFKAAYDSIDRCSLCTAMEELHIPQKLTALVKATMNNTECRIKIQNRLSELINP